MLVGPELIGWIVDITQNWKSGILFLVPACFAVIAVSSYLALIDKYLGIVKKNLQFGGFNPSLHPKLILGYTPHLGKAFEWFVIVQLV